jgi:Ca2+-binding EF-hand superfamily protein
LDKEFTDQVISNTFKFIDINKNGYISVTDFKNFLQKTSNINESEHEIERMMREIVSEIKLEDGEDELEVSNSTLSNNKNVEKIINGKSEIVIDYD